MTYETLALAEVRVGLEEAGRDVEASFATLDARQLNWRPDAGRWSVAQCLDHLVSANALMMRGMDDAMAGIAPRTVWQRLPGWPRVIGRLLVRSQAPQTARRFTAPAAARPAASDIPADIVARFGAQARAAAGRIATIDEGAAARTIMTSPFVRVITYSVLDGWRLLYAHDRRHIEQARRVTQLPHFPR